MKRVGINQHRQQRLSKPLNLYCKGLSGTLYHSWQHPWHVKLNVRKNIWFKIVASTLYKGRALDGKKNPISHIERWGFVFEMMPIRYCKSGYRPCTGKIAQVSNPMISMVYYSQINGLGVTVICRWYFRNRSDILNPMLTTFRIILIHQRGRLKKPANRLILNKIYQFLALLLL